MNLSAGSSAPKNASFFSSEIVSFMISTNISLALLMHESLSLDDWKWRQLFSSSHQLVIVHPGPWRALVLARPWCKPFIICPVFSNVSSSAVFHNWLSVSSDVNLFSSTVQHSVYEQRKLLSSSCLGFQNENSNILLFSNVHFLNWAFIRTDFLIFHFIL